jgi:hypothetical protein
MAQPGPLPSRRLLRAAVAERAELRRSREKLLAARESLRAELTRIEAHLEAVDERETLLERLTGPQPEQRASQPMKVSTQQNSPSASPTLLRGPAIRRVAVELLVDHPDRPEALHYRAWFGLLREAGYSVAGKDPLAVFLTQLSRSPAVRKGTQSGVYELDRSAVRRLRQRLEALHEELRALAAPTTTTTDLAAVRARRAQLHAGIGQAEKALEEAVAVLERPSGEPLRVAS